MLACWGVEKQRWGQHDARPASAAKPSRPQAGRLVFTERTALLEVVGFNVNEFGNTFLKD